MTLRFRHRTALVNVPAPRRYRTCAGHEADLPVDDMPSSLSPAKGPWPQPRGRSYDRQPHEYSMIETSFLPFALVQSSASSETICGTVTIAAPALCMRCSARSLPTCENEAEASADT